MHEYWGFGLHIKSEMVFPELFPHLSENTDVTILTGRVPEQLAGDVMLKRPISLVGEQEYLLDMANVAKYYAKNGNTIIVEPYKDADERSIRLFLLGTVMAVVLHQRGQISIHSSAIVSNKQLLLFAGDSGAGKSTLAAFFSTKGYTVFTDDVCVLQSHETQQIYGTAAYPMIKLWEKTIAGLGHDSFNRDFSVRPEMPKYGNFFYEDFIMEPLPVAKIFLLNPVNNSKEIKTRRLSQLEAFAALEKQSYKNHLVAGAKLRTLHFSLLSALASQVNVFQVSRPFTGSSPELLFDHIKPMIADE